MSLPHLLEEVARQSDLVLRGHTSLRERVTVRLEGLSMERSLRSILQGHNYVLVSRGAVQGGENVGRPRWELWILPSRESRPGGGALGGERPGVPDDSDSAIAELLAIVENSEDSWEKEDAILALVETGRRSVALPMIRRALGGQACIDEPHCDNRQ